MDLHVGRWDWRHRGYGNRAAIAAATSALRGLTEGALRDELETDLATAFGTDPTVYLVRRLGFACAVRTTGRSPAQQTRHLSRAVVGAVIDTIRRNDGCDGNVVRFRDQAEYVARFLVDLARGLAWSRWYHRPFARLRQERTGATIRVVLEAHAADIARILGDVRRSGALDDVLAALGDDEAARLCGRATETSVPDGRRPAIEPLFAVAVRVTSQLGWLVASASDLDVLRAAYLASTSGFEDWRDAHTLAVRVGDVVAFLHRRGALRLPDVPAEGSAVADAVATFEWLDRATLAAILVALQQERAAPPASRSPISVRQQRLLDAIAEAVRTSGVDVRALRRRPHSAKLRILAAFGERATAWADDDAAVDAVLDAVLTVARALAEPLARRHAPIRRWDEIERGISAIADPVRALAAVRTLRRFGDVAMPALVATLGGAGGDAPVTRPALDESAGIFLLVRAVEDLRLSRLLGSLDAGDEGPSLGDALLLLGARWAGPTAFESGSLPDALRCWGGGPEARLEASAGRWAALSARALGALQVALLRAIRVPWLDDPSAMRLVPMELGGARVWIASDVRGLVCPLGWVGDDEREAAAWLATAWHEATAVTPAIVRDEDDVVAEQVRGGVRCLAGAGGTNVTADLTLTLLAGTLLRVWARWLRGVGESSLGYLLRELVRRPGIVRDSPTTIDVVIVPRPLDVVLGMSGYLAATGPIRWLGDRRVQLTIGMGG